MKNSADLWGCYPPWSSASVDNTLLDLQNSSYPTQPHSIIAKNHSAISTLNENPVPWISFNFEFQKFGSVVVWFLFSLWQQRKSPYVYLVKLLDADVIFHSGRAPCPSCCYSRLAQPELIDKKWFCHQGHQALKKEQLQCKKKATSSLSSGHVCRMQTIPAID